MDIKIRNKLIEIKCVSTGRVIFTKKLLVAQNFGNR